MADTVSVTQADATFVADILELAETLELAGNDLASIRNGIWNDEPSDLGRLLRMAAKHRRASTQPAPAFPREAVAKALWSVSQNCSWDDAKADSDCSNAVKGCYEHADAVAALLQGKQP